MWISLSSKFSSNRQTFENYEAKGWKTHKEWLNDMQNSRPRADYDDIDVFIEWKVNLNGCRPNTEDSLGYPDRVVIHSVNKTYEKRIKTAMNV